MIGKKLWGVLTKNTAHSSALLWIIDLSDTVHHDFGGSYLDTHFQDSKGVNNHAVFAKLGSRDFCYYPHGLS